MTDIYFSTNPSDPPQLEGLYISERNPPGFIRGNDFGTVGMAGKCVRGPLTPVQITSPGRFLEVFGGRDFTAHGTGGARVGEIHAALLNKRFGEIIARRVAAADAVKAAKSFSNAVPTPIISVRASSVGAWGNSGLTAAIENATDGDANKFNVRVNYLGEEVVYQNCNTQAGQDNLAALVGSDDARFVDLVKLADGRPINAAPAALTGGSEGTLAVTDYNAGVNELAVYPGIDVVLVPEAVPTPASFHSNLVALAAQVADRIFLTWAQVHGQAVATEIAQAAAQITTRTDRIWWCFNSPFTMDPDTSSELQQAPHIWLASILSQIDIDIHPGAAETTALLAGIKRMTTASLSRLDLISLRKAGICTLEKLDSGFQFRSVVTTDLNPGKTEGTRRRMTDFLQLSASARLRNFVKAKNTKVNRATMAAELTAFSQGLRGQERVIENFEIDQVSVNSKAQRSQGTEKLLWRVDLIDHILSLVFETEIGTGVTIERAA